MKDRLENIKRRALVDIEVYTQRAATLAAPEKLRHLEAAKLCAEIFALLEHGAIPVDTSLLTDERLGAGKGPPLRICLVCEQQFDGQQGFLCGDPECDETYEKDQDEAARELAAGI